MATTKSAAKPKKASPAKKAEPAKKSAAPAKKAPVKAAKAAAPAKKRTPNAAFMKPVTPTAMLAAIVGASPLPRTEVTKKVWDYIKKYNLQDKDNRRMINADDKLKPVFGGKKQVSMFEMTKLVSAQLK